MKEGRQTLEEKWNARFHELEAYKAKHGHCNVPTKSGKLGYWVNTQRTQYRLSKEGKYSFMTDERVHKLESIGFRWSLNFGDVTCRDKTLENMWDTRFHELEAYKAKHGHCNVPKSSGKLGTWVKHQRRNYRFLNKGKYSSMTNKRVQKLESIGFQWSSRRSDNKSAVHAAVFAGGATLMEPVSTSTPDGAHHRGTEASSNDHTTNADCHLNDSRDISCDEPDVVISSKAASKNDSEFRPFLHGGGYLKRVNKYG